MIAVDIQPYSLTSDIGFQRLIAKLCPNYRIPSRKYFTDKIIPDIFMKVKAKIQISLDEISSLSLTTDIWTASTNNAPFLSVTGHWLSDEFEQCRAVLRVVPFPGSHTAEIISEQLHIVLNEYKISNKIFLVLRVSAANMVGGMRKCGVQSLSCFIRTLQLSVNDSIFSQKAVSNIIANSRKIVSHFNHSPLAISKLTEIQEQLKLDKHKLIQDVSTRWNSTYNMLKINLEQLKALDNDIPTLSSYQWTIVEKVVQLLSPFEDISKESSNRTSTISMIIPTILALRLFLLKATKHTGEFSGIISTVEEFSASTEKRFASYINEKFLCLATFLDPRFKLKFQKDNIKEDTIKKWVMDIVEHQSEINSIDSQTGDSSSNDDQDNETYESVPKTVSLSKLLDDFESNKPMKINSDLDVASTTDVQPKLKRSKSVTRRCAKELDQYLTLPTLQRSEDPLLWWKKTQETLPILSNLASKYLSAPPSSVESERLFSTMNLQGKGCVLKMGKLLCFCIIT